MAEVIEFFRHTIASANDEEEKSDLQPIPPELHGAITRTNPELLRHYEHLGIALGFIFFFFCSSHQLSQVNSLLILHYFY